MKGFLEVDFIFALAIFLVFFVFISIAVSGNFGNYKSAVYEDVFESKVRSVSNFLIFSPGQPENWSSNYSNVSEIGFSYFYNNRSYPNLIDIKKINAAKNMSYANLTSLMGVKDFKIVLYDLDYNTNYTLGGDSMRKKTTSVDRFVAIRNSFWNISRGKFTVTVWD
ncbi:hypothetical protein H0N95_01255 [Candidatus Micrarchaeota archaeon]|nr:hypothetical protein [Candidatus Micrarchaeota archaeon]